MFQCSLSRRKRASFGGTGFRLRREVIITHFSLLVIFLYLSLIHISSIYTESSVAILKAAINVANVVVATPGVTEEIIDSAYNMLKADVYKRQLLKPSRRTEYPGS